MINCALFPTCGGCLYRNLDEHEYRRKKEEMLSVSVAKIKQNHIVFGNSVFIADGTRRRATMAFSVCKNQLLMGFNHFQSHEIADCRFCALLSDKINRNLENIYRLLSALCATPFQIKKGKKVLSQKLSSGDIYICEVDNGIDIMLEIPFALQLEHRLIIAEQINSYPDVIRLSYRRRMGETPETVIEKTRPLIHNHGTDIYVPAGTFLQASKAGEKALMDLVLKYIGDRQGKIADLFCGVGTFSYPLAQNKNNHILAVDSSAELLSGFQVSVNQRQLNNIKIENRNLFKYPLDEKELENLDIVVFDPPRAGAAAQVAKLAKCDKSLVVIAVSCNPRTFVNDANTLISGGYTLKEMTMVDQFVYSGHTELVAWFEKE